MILGVSELGVIDLRWASILLATNKNMFTSEGLPRITGCCIFLCFTTLQYNLTISFLLISSQERRRIELNEIKMIMYNEIMFCVWSASYQRGYECDEEINSNADKVYKVVFQIDVTNNLITFTAPLKYQVTVIYELHTLSIIVGAREHWFNYTQINQLIAARIFSHWVRIKFVAIKKDILMLTVTLTL